MKKIKFNGKLNLSKERISNLSANQMDKIRGGEPGAIGGGDDQERQSWIICNSKVFHCETNTCTGGICSYVCGTKSKVNVGVNISF
ncbi:MAG: class I lanthipeptide [Bacteroidetes bacterium]|nr:class I lanthipeptide [Bacteroidota bacterium]